VPARGAGRLAALKIAKITFKQVALQGAMLRAGFSQEKPIQAIATAAGQLKPHRGKEERGTLVEKEEKAKEAHTSASCRQVVSQQSPQGGEKGFSEKEKVGGSRHKREARAEIQTHRIQKGGVQETAEKGTGSSWLGREKIRIETNILLQCKSERTQCLPSSRDSRIRGKACQPLSKKESNENQSPERRTLSRIVEVVRFIRTSEPVDIDKNQVDRLERGGSIRSLGYFAHQHKTEFPLCCTCIGGSKSTL